jgi:LuxR family transcriptional regulator, maltose regulon positive regulatory protein
LPLPRLRVGGRLNQVRAADLAFTVAEVAELLAECELQQQLSEDDLAALQARTEGWAAGLRLAALSLEGQPDPHQFVTQLAGEDRTIADYLTGEVLERQPAELRDFLLRTCVVDELSGDLADALTGGDDGESTLTRLERANAFVVAIGSRRGFYRYHRLFAELLRYELRREAPGQAAWLHRRAAGWYAERGLGDSAIQQALLAKDWGFAADLIARHAPSRILRGDAATVHDQVGRLPDELVQADPALALLAAAEPRAAEPPDEAHRDRLALLRATMDTALAWQAGDLDQAVVAGEAALALRSRIGTDSVDDDAWAITLANVGAAQLWAGRLDDAEPRLREGLAVATRAGPATAELACLSQLGLLHALRGELDEALQWGGSALKLATEHGWSSSTQAAGGHLALAWAYYYADDLGESSSCLDQAAAASGEGRQPMALAVAILRARLQRARGDLTGALGAVAMARRSLAGWRPPTALWRWLLLTEAELRGGIGQPQSSRALLKNLNESGPLLGGEAVTLARLRLAEGDAAGAAETIAPVLDKAQPGGFLTVPAEAWLTDALARDELADHDRAAASLERALGLAEQGGHRRSFLDTGAPARSMLIRYRQRVPAFWSYVDELVQASAESVRVTVNAPKLIEHLTEREQTVLRYLPSLMTYEEIATDLVVSLNTVKTHAHGIFRKLGVTGRREAVRSARELHLL